MKKKISILFMSVGTLFFMSCNLKSGTNKDAENVKHKIEESVDKITDRAKEGAGDMKDALNDSQEAVNKKTDSIKTDVKKEIK